MIHNPLTWDMLCDIQNIMMKLLRHLSWENGTTDICQTTLFCADQGFLSLTRSKLRLCWANHRACYFSNLACDWLSIVWAWDRKRALVIPSTMAWLVHHQWYRSCFISPSANVASNAKSCLIGQSVNVTSNGWSCLIGPLANVASDSRFCSIDPSANVASNGYGSFIGPSASIFAWQKLLYWPASKHCLKWQTLQIGPSANVASNGRSFLNELPLTKTD